MSANGRRAFDVVVWALLLTMPYWMGAIGGYTELATRVVVMGLAAMSLNFLLGFTGVLSFGHAAYFGARRLRHGDGHQSISRRTPGWAWRWASPSRRSRRR